MKLTASGALPLVGVALKSAVGAVTVMNATFVFVFEPWALVAVNATVNVPAPVYVCEGFCNVDVAPSPNVQAHDVGVPVDRSVKLTISGALPMVGVALKSAVGAGGAVTVMNATFVFVFEPWALVAVNATVNVPAPV